MSNQHSHSDWIIFVGDTLIFIGKTVAFLLPIFCLTFIFDEFETNKQFFKYSLAAYAAFCVLQMFEAVTRSMELYFKGTKR